MKRALLACALAGLLAGCGAGSSGGHVERIWGSPGREAGRFVKPRGVAVDRSRGLVYVLDMSGRLQKFDTGGRFLASWAVPDREMGTGEGLALTPGGQLLVADTHYQRVLRYSPEGKLLGSFGRRGKGPGEFIFPVAVAVDAAGNIYVAEYGGNDRVQKFGPRGRFLRQWGSLGKKPGEFLRPSGLALDADGNLLVADAANHRVQRFSPEGKLLACWGRRGGGIGELSYPYDLVALPDGSVAVLEHYNNRIQRFSAEGKPLGLFGGAGTGKGRFYQPWCLALGPGGGLYVTDTMNHRLQVVRLGGARGPAGKQASRLLNCQAWSLQPPASSLQPPACGL